MSDWGRRSLAELTTKIGSGATPRGGANVYQANGVSLIRSQNVLDNRLRIDEIAHISDRAARDLAGVTVESGDVLLNITGDSVARCAVVDDLVLPARVNQHVAIIRTTPELDSRFLQRVLVSPEFKERLLSTSQGGGTRKALTKSDIARLVVPVPPEYDQRTIADVLGCLDDKIAGNAMLMDTLRKHLSLELELAVVSGHVSTRLGDVVEFHNRRRVPLSAGERDQRLGSVPYYGATGRFGFVDQAIFNEKLVLVGEDGSVVTDNGHPVVQYVWGPAWVNNHAHVLTGVGVSTELLSLLVERADVRALVTGAVQPKLSMGNLRTLVLQLPLGDCLERIERLCTAEMATFRSLTEESVLLTSMRDLLLPSLISGKLRVKDAEERVEAVV